jgi:anti-anti-sigma factor
MVDAGYLCFRVERDGAVCVLSVIGVLDFLTAEGFAERAGLAVGGRAERLVLDLSGLAFADCCGARALAAVTRAAPGDCPVIVRSARPVVRRLLDLMNLDLESGHGEADVDLAARAGAEQLHAAGAGAGSPADELARAAVNESYDHTAMSAERGLSHD